MLTKEVHGAGNNCKPLHASEINIYDVCALREQNIRLKVGGRNSPQIHQRMQENALLLLLTCVRL